MASECGVLSVFSNTGQSYIYIAEITRQVLSVEYFKILTFISKFWIFKIVFPGVSLCFHRAVSFVEHLEHLLLNVIFSLHGFPVQCS